MRPAFWTAFGTLLALGGCSSLERQLLFPGTATHGRPDAIVAPSPRYELIPLTLRDGTRIVAQFAGALDTAGRPLSHPARVPTVLYFYGNGACLADSAGVVESFRRLGCNVLVPEYPGYGMSDGTPSETALYATADAAYDYVVTRPEVDRRHVVATGWSLGAAVAIDLASRRPIAQVVTFSAFTSLPAVAHRAAPWAPTSLVVRSRFDNARKISALTCPILLVHGQQDSLVPPMMAAELAAAASRARVQRLDLAHAGHNDVFSAGGPDLWAALDAFLAPAAVTTTPPP